MDMQFMLKLGIAIMGVILVVAWMKIPHPHMAEFFKDNEPD